MQWEVHIMKLEFNDWRTKSEELLKQYGVLFQKQLYDLLIKNGYQISYQKFNDYQRENLMIRRTRLFCSSNALITMIRRNQLSRLKYLEIILINSFLINNDLKPDFVHDTNFYRGVKALVNALIQRGKITEIQKHAMLTQLNHYRSFLEKRNELLAGDYEASIKDQTLFNSLYQRGVHFRNASKGTLYFVLPDKHDSLSLPKLVKIVVDLQEQYEERMKIPLKISLDIVCLTERKRKEYQKQFDYAFKEMYLREVEKRKLILINDPVVNIHSSGLEKYVKNIEQYIIS